LLYLSVAGSQHDGSARDEAKELLRISLTISIPT